MRDFGLKTLVLVALAGAGELRAAHFALDLGWKMDNLEQRFSAPPGYAGLVSSQSAFVRARPIFGLSRSFFWEPSVGVAVPWRSGADGFTRTIVSHFCLDLAWEATTGFRLRFGPGVQWNFAFSQAGAVPLSNGSSVSTFYLPGGTSHSFLFLADAGLEVRVSEKVSLGVDFWVSELLNSSRRRVHGFGFLGLYL